MSGSLNLSSIFPCGYCGDPVTFMGAAWNLLWFHKDCVDEGSFTFLAYSTANVSWICCRCNHPNFDQFFFHSFENKTTNNFDNLNFSGSENVNSPNSYFAHTQHSSPIPPLLVLKTLKETGIHVGSTRGGIYSTQPVQRAMTHKFCPTQHQPLSHEATLAQLGGPATVL